MKIKVIAGTNDLTTTHPEVAAEWHPTKNGSFLPSETTCNSNKRVWWQCKNGHEYESIIHNRAICISGCPYCSGRYAIPGETDLPTLHPEIAIQWHPTKNSQSTAIGISPNSVKLVWWQCEKGHEWQKKISIRTASHIGCPLCKTIGRVGETLTMWNGMDATIIAYRNSKDIDVEFADHYVAKHITYGEFQERLVRNPNLPRKKAPYKTRPKKNSDGTTNKRIGETVMTKYGIATIIRYYGVANCTVQFTDGTCVENIHYSQFKKGYVKNPNYWVGKTNISKSGQKMTVIAYKNCYNVDVQFEDGTIVRYRTIESFRNGTIRNPNK